MRIKEVLLGLTIGVILLMFLVFGAKLIYEKPEYDSYCAQNEIYEKNISLGEKPIYEECSKEYDLKDEEYSKKMFLFSLIVGIIIIILSTILIEITSISGGTMLGSLMFIIQGTANYWRYMGDWVRFIILGVSLALLIYLGYWLNKKEIKKKRKEK